MQVASACTGLTHLELSNFRCMSDPPLHEFVSRCPSLAHLSLAGASITDASLDLIASHCPNLSSLSIKFCRKLLEPGVRALAGCTRLESLNAALVPGVSDVSAPLLFQGATALKTLVLNQSPLTDTSLSSLSSHCHGLEELALHGCPRLTNEGLKSLASSCLCLRYLSLSFCDQVSDAGIISIANKCHHLIKIRLDGCRQLSNPCVKALCRPAWAQQVRPERDQVRGSSQDDCNGEVFRLPGEYAAARLRYLSMQSCPKISDDIFDHLLAAPALRFVDIARARLTEWAIHSFHSRRPDVELCISGVPYCPMVDC
ncbi:hypothetical protein CLOM_g11704 [Closterium sp. NIES-68]|nr:hypothetical protein CLOM_g11704 [Closterium sp. NIES-68]GJP61965.1 hypothetical protein CLOP_g19082 [Closterium sp. NIES-67]